MSKARAGSLRRIGRAALVLLITLIFAGLASTVIALPPVAAGLSEEVGAKIVSGRTRNPVTATLLDFRGYDTFLEMAVFLLAAVAIRALRRGGPPPIMPDNDILLFLSRALPPVMILISGYLLVAGLETAGGAFQAGAVLAAAGVLLILAGRPVPLVEDGIAGRLGLAGGLAMFIALGLGGMLFADAFLDYPQRGAGTILMLLEAGVTVSVALTLLAMFVGVLRNEDLRDESSQSGTEKQ